MTAEAGGDIMNMKKISKSVRLLNPSPFRIVYNIEEIKKEATGMEEDERIRVIYCRWLGAPPPEERREALWQRIQGELDRQTHREGAAEG